LLIGILCAIRRTRAVDHTCFTATPTPSAK
jgi:hypothetical protein